MSKHHHLLLSMLIVSSMTTYQASQYTSVSHDNFVSSFDDKRGYIGVSSKEENLTSSHISKDHQSSLPQIKERRMLSRSNFIHNPYQGYKSLLPSVKKHKRNKRTHMPNDNQGDESSLCEKKRLFPLDSNLDMNLHEILQLIEKKEKEINKRNKRLDKAYFELMKEKEIFYNQQNNLTSKVPEKPNVIDPKNMFYEKKLWEIHESYQEIQDDLTNLTTSAKKFLQKNVLNYTPSPKSPKKEERKVFQKPTYPITELRGPIPFHLRKKDFENRVNELTFLICTTSRTHGERNPKTLEAVENAYNEKNNQTTSNLLFNDLCFINIRSKEETKSIISTLTEKRLSTKETVSKSKSQEEKKVLSNLLETVLLFINVLNNRYQNS